MRITQELLQAKEACQEQLDMFAVDFPDGTEITAAICRAHPGYDYDWAAANLLTTPEKLAAYLAARAPLWAEYEAARAPLWAEYEAAKAQLLAEYEAAKAEVLAEFEAAKAEVFGRICEEIP